MHELILVADFSQVAHVQGPGHPERPARLETLEQVIGDLSGAIPVMTDSEPASRDAICRVHAGSYVDSLLELRGTSAVLDPDTRVMPDTIDAALSAAGCGLAAFDAVWSGAARRAFSVVRPPGHHAESDRAMGFCYINNVAVIAEAARHAGAERVLIVDWDVHHGNGTQHSFEDRADIAVFNVHQFPFYPGSGALNERGTGAGEGYTVNCPLPAGCGDAEYVTVFDDVLAPFARAYAPEVILVSAGYDAHVRDPLGAMRVTDGGFGELAKRVRTLADELCDGKLVATLEGGYDLDGLAGGFGTTVAAWAANEVELADLRSDDPDVARVVSAHQKRQ